MSSLQARKGKELRKLAKVATKSIPHYLPESRSKSNIYSKANLLEREDISDINLRQMCRMYIVGATDEEVAFQLGISVITLLRLKSKYEAVKKAIVQGKKASNDRVEKSLYRRAVGFEIPEKTKERVISRYKINKIGKLTVKYPIYALKTTKIVTKYFPPDVNAAMRWLVNRRAAKWKDSSPTFNMNQNNVMAFPKAVPEDVDGDLIKRTEANSRSLQRHGIIVTAEVSG